MSTSPALSESQLAEFRQKAGPILAEARGLTPGALAKLGEIARDVGLADDQVQDAIRALHGGKPKAVDPAVEKFRKRFRKDLSERKTIIGPEIEARIIAGGIQKYELTEPVILEVLTDVSAELGLRRITGNEALAHFVEMVDGAVGDKTWLNRQSWDRLRAASEKWGLTFEDADQLVQQKIDANRRASFRGKLVRWITTYGSVGVVACALIVLFVLINRPKDEPVTGDPGGDPSTSPGSGEIKPSTTKGPPEWWGYELAITASTAKREVPGFAALLDKLLREEPAERGSGYAELVKLGAGLAPAASGRATIEELIVSFHAREPDDVAAQQLRDAVVGLIPQRTTPLPMNESVYERAFWGVSVARQTMKATVVRPGRPAAMAAALSAAIGITITPESGEGEQAAKMEAALSLQLFQHLVSEAPHHPAIAPVLHKFLADTGRLPTAAEVREPMEANYLAALLPVSAANWRDHQELIVRLARSKNPLVTLKMADVLVKVSDRGLQSLLGEELVRQTGAKPKSSNPRDVARSIRQALGTAGVSSAQSQDDRWELLRIDVDPVLAARAPVAGNSAELLQKSTQIARLATLAAALSQGEAGLPVFDELQAPKKEPPPEEKDDFAETPKGVAARGRPLSNREKQQLEQMIATLRAYHDHPPIQRMGSLRALAQVAPQVPDLTYDQALAVARFLLAEKSDEEQQAIQVVMPNFKFWKQLKLALADQVEGTKLTAAQVGELVSGLAGEGSYSGSESPRRALLLSVQHDLGSGKTGGSGGGSSGALKAAEELAETYRTRARLAGVASTELAVAEAPGQILELIAVGMAKGSDKKSSLKEASLAEQLEAARFLGTSDLRKTVLLQRLILRGVTERITASRPRQAEAAAQIMANLETVDAKAENLLVQLYHGEAATLQMGMLYGAN